MKYLAPICVALLLSLPAARADISVEKRTEIQKLLRLTGIERLVKQMETQMISSLKAQMPGVPDTFWIRFQSKINTTELVDKIVPIYDRYYSLEDLQAINAFYETPTGEKVLATLPQVMQESTKVGQEWGEKIGRQAADEAKQEQKTKP